MYCVKCGAELNEGVKFCSNCGTPVHRMESQSVQKNSVKGETSARSSTEEWGGNAQKKLNEVLSFAREKSAPFLEKGKEMISDYKKEIQSECESKGNLKRKIVIGLFSFAIIIILLGIWASSGSNGNNSSSYGSSDDYDTQYSFTSAQSVMDYVTSRTFESGNTSVRIEYDGVYVNGTWTLAAPKIVDFSSTQAMIVATSQYSGQQSRFIVDCQGNYLKDCNSNDYFYLK